MKRIVFIFVVLGILISMFTVTGHALSAMDIDFYELFNKNSAIMMLIDPKTGEIVHANKTAVDFYGYSAEQLEGMKIQQLNMSSPEDTEKEMQGAISGRVNFFVFKHRLADGSIRTVEIHSTPYTEGDKTIMLAMVHDITDHYELERQNRKITGLFVLVLLGTIVSVGLFSRRLSHSNKHLEILNASLKKSEYNLRLILDSTAEGIYGMDMEGKCTFCNRSCLDLLHYREPEELLGENMHELIHYKRADGTEFPLEECQIFKAFLKGETVHVEDEVLWRADGTCFPAEYHSYPQRRNGEIVGAVVTFSDITERKRAKDELISANEQLRGKQYSLEEQNALIEELNAQLEEENQRNLEQKEILQAIIDSLEAGIMMSNLSGEVNFINKAWKELFDYAVLGQTQHFCENFYMEDDVCCDVKIFLRNMLEGVKENGDTAGELRDLIKDDMSRYDTDLEQVSPVKRFLNFYSNPCTSQSGHTFGRVFVARDVSHQKEVERLKLELINTVSHELRTPMSSVLGFSELLLTRDLTKERIKEYIGIINSEAERLTRLINDFLDVQKMESGRDLLNKQIHNLDAIIEEAVKRFDSEDSGHRIMYDNKTKNGIPVCCDKDKMIQLLSNLLSNAIKFSPGGGDIRVNISIDEHEVRVSVTDHGLGIPEEAIGKLFTKFCRIDNSDRREIGGTGLGLAICKEIVSAHGGEIGVDSVHGEGSTFYFSLPLLKDSRRDACGKKDA